MQISLSSVANGVGGFKLLGETPHAYARQVAGAGDVNGDGLDDILVGASGESEFEGAAYVVYGGVSATAPISLSTIAAGDGGFKIAGQGNNRERIGSAVAPAGDLNGDGRADLLIGAPGGADGCGAAYVVFGGASDGEPVQLADVAAGVGGYILESNFPRDWVGQCLDSVGDVNGDGREDLVIGSSAGNVYVAFTGDAPPTSPVSLAEIAAGRGGFVIVAEGGRNGKPVTSVAGAGDVNGDGLADILIGRCYDGIAGVRYSFSGAAYVAFGKMDGTPVRYDQLANGNGGVRIFGEEPGDYAGTDVAAAGDVNNDGYADLLIGSPGNSQGGDGAGAAYVVYGGPSLAPTIELRDIALGHGGFKIIGMYLGESAGYSVASAGDVNGDGLGDLLIHAVGYDQGGARVGAPCVVFGKPTPFETVWLKDVAAGAAGIQLIGEAGEYVESVAAAGDLNGDGLGDLLIGGQSYRVDEGVIYAVYGQSVPMQIGGDNGDRLAGGVANDRLFGLAGNDTVIAGAGNDQLEGNGGFDLAFGNGGNDLLSGGDDKDTLHGGLGDDTLDGGAGYDAAAFGTAAAGVSVDLAAGTANGDGNDVLRSIEEVFGSKFADEIRGDAGDNWFTGGAGNDTLDGGAGRDTASYADAANGVTIDLITGAASGHGTDRLIGIEAVVGGRFDDVIGGDTGNNWFSGGAGNDTIAAADGQDTVLGGAGDDRLDGGNGSDWLSGGAGADVFSFAPRALAASDVDWIDDFTQGEDRIDVRAFDFADAADVLALIASVGSDLVLDLGAVGGPQVVIDDATAVQADDFLI